jgi:hypothetical protein
MLMRKAPARISYRIVASIRHELPAIQLLVSNHEGQLDKQQNINRKPLMSQTGTSHIVFLCTKNGSKLITSYIRLKSIGSIRNMSSD